ncbi:MAG: hypothetical protein ACI85V_003339 [bacterium]
MLLFRDLVTAICIELVRHLQHPNENETTSVPANCRSMQQGRRGPTFVKLGRLSECNQR